MEERQILFEVNGSKAKSVAYIGDVKHLRAFVDIEANFELFEDELLRVMAEWKFERVWFTIPPSYDLNFTDRKIWRAYEDYLIEDGVKKIIVFYSADGKKFLKDLTLDTMDQDTLTKLDKKFPGILKHMVEPEVNERVVLSTIYNYVNGDISKCTFDIQNKDINLTKITQFVKDKMGRKFASAHIMALRELRRKLDETSQQN